MADLSPARVQALKDRIAKATRGPWRVIETRYGIHEPRCAMCDTVAERRIATVWDHPQLKGPLGVVNLFVTIHPVVDWEDEKVYRGVSLDEADADLIAHAREDLPDLLAALEAQGQTIARLEKEKAEAESTFTSFAEHHAATARPVVGSFGLRLDRDPRGAAGASLGRPQGDDMSDANVNDHYVLDAMERYGGLRGRRGAVVPPRGR